MIGFFFIDKHSSDFNTVVMERAKRNLTPPKRRNDYQVSGRHGTVDFGDETYGTRQIPVNIYLISRNEKELRKLARDVAFWLSGKGRLLFDDEPQQAYDAVVYEEIDAEQLFRVKRVTVTFECQPFAKTVDFMQSTSHGIRHGHTASINSQGTQATPPRIIINNTSNSTITSITITRRALRR